MKDLSEKEFKEFISKGNCAIDFWASWCGPCKMLGPVFDEIESELSSIKFAKVNVDEAGDVPVEFGVRGVPTIILFKDGVEVNRIVGFIPKPALKAQIEEIFS